LEGPTYSLERFTYSGAPRAKARGSSTCFVGPAFAEAAPAYAKPALRRA
jgi:hypothetical protein